jgi:hypothetical protein
MPELPPPWNPPDWLFRLIVVLWLTILTLVVFGLETSP